VLLVVAYIGIGDLASGRCVRERHEVEELDVFGIENGSDFRREVGARLVVAWNLGDEGLRGTESEEGVWATWGGHFGDTNYLVNNIIRFEKADYLE
jgi:hypothetical protein